MKILNDTYDLLTPDQASALWVRQATKHKRINKEALGAVLKKRFGDKFLSSNPFDVNANDDAIANGYHLVNGSEMTKEEWDISKRLGLMISSTSLFGTKGLEDEPEVSPTDRQREYATLAKRVAKEFLGIDIRVKFVKSDSIQRACYGGRELILNLTQLGNGFFTSKNWTYDNYHIIIHEVCHEYGHHTETAYMNNLSKLGGKLLVQALNNPEFFN